MSSTQFIQIAALVLAPSVALLIAYQDRRQKRHLELYRVNPDVGLKPPLSAPVAWFLRHSSKFFLAAYLGMFLFYAFKPDPVSKADIVFMVMNAAGTSFVAGAMLTFRLMRPVMAAIDRIVDLLGAMVGETKGRTSGPEPKAPRENP